MKGNEKEIFLQIENHILNDKKPSIYLTGLLKEGLLNDYPFSIIGDLKSVNQNPKYHPEGDVFTHTMMVIDEGAKERDRSHSKRAFMWGLLLHDVGKKPTTKMRKGRLTSYDHDKAGKNLAREFLEYFDEDESFIDEVVGLVRWHMQSLFVTKDSRFQDIDSMLEDVDVNEIVLVALADRLGRGGINKNERNNTISDINKFEDKLNKHSILAEK